MDQGPEPPEPGRRQTPARPGRGRSWAPWSTPRRRGGGIPAAPPGPRLAALAPSRHGGRPSCGACGLESAQGVRRRQAQGRPSRAQGWQEARTFGGLTRAPALVRAPAGNGCAVRLRRTRQEKLW